MAAAPRAGSTPRRSSAYKPGVAAAEAELELGAADLDAQQPVAFMSWAQRAVAPFGGGRRLGRRTGGRGRR